METVILIVGVLGFAAGVVIGLMIATGTTSGLRDDKLAMAGDIGQLTEELHRMEGYLAEVERDKAIAMESSDRWRAEAFETQNKLAAVTEKLATEKRRSAALLGHNRKYREERVS